jgi:pimeloyl-ACP methyl ester carboxylesterase
MPIMQRAGVAHHVDITDGQASPVVLKPHQPYPIEVFADDIAWMCDELKLRKPILVGHSMGGIVAFDIAARYPGLPGAIVMLDSAIVLPKAARAGIPAFLEKLQGPDYASAMRDFVERVFFLPTDDPVRKRSILEAMAGAPQHVMAAAYRGLADYDPERARDRITIPSLYIVANEPSPRTDMARLRELIPHLSVGQTVGSGHFCQLEVPDQIGAMIGQFMRVALATES